MFASQVINWFWAIQREIKNIYVELSSRLKWIIWYVKSVITSNVKSRKCAKNWAIYVKCTCHYMLNFAISFYIKMQLCISICLYILTFILQSIPELEVSIKHKESPIVLRHKVIKLFKHFIPLTYIEPDSEGCPISTCFHISTHHKGYSRCEKSKNTMKSSWWNCACKFSIFNIEEIIPFSHLLLNMNGKENTNHEKTTMDINVTNV